MTIEYFRVKNFDQFQHYKKRSPPWIKLYHDILDDYEFASLPDKTKAHLMSIWLLASRNDNKLPNDPKWIAKRIAATDDVDLTDLFEKGFLEPLPAGDDASNLIADCKQSAPLAEERREEESDAIKIANNLFTLWQDVMDKPNAILTKDRKTKVSARLAEGYSEEDLRQAIHGCALSKFHMGKNDQNTPHNDFNVILKSGQQVEKFRDLATADVPAASIVI